MLFTFSHKTRTVLNRCPGTYSAVPTTSHKNATRDYKDKVDKGIISMIDA